jgi:phage gp46-like protein
MAPRELITDPAMTLDWLLEPVDGSGDGELADAVAVALGTDRLADPSDVLPGLNDDNRRGHWSDAQVELIHQGWPAGTRLWLLQRAKITGPEAREGSLIARVETYIREALQPFIDRQIATRMTVRAQRIGLDRVDADVTLYRGHAVLVDLRYSALWDKIRT